MAEKPSKFKLMLIRWSKVISVVGLFIVFAGFIAKDIKRETLKDSIESVDTSQALFQTKQAIGTLHEDLNRFVIRDKFKVERFKQGTRDVYQLVTILDRQESGADDEIKELRSFEAQVKQLCERASCAESFDKGIEEPNKRLLVVQDLLGRIKNEKQKIMNANPKARSEALCDLLKRIDIQLLELDKIDEHLAVAFAIEYAKIFTQSKENERQYNVYTKLSWWLYGAGWFLTLLGTLFDVEKIKVGG
jgi:hypothetical protein